jgi:CHAT domain-containing protein
LDTADLGPLPEETFIWVVTRNRWWITNTRGGTATVANYVQALRCGLDASAWEEAGAARCRSLLGQDYTARDLADGKPLPFSTMRAHELYKALFGGVEEHIRGKHLIVVPTGVLASLPLQVLVTEAPAGGPSSVIDANTAWLVRRNAISMLPSVASLIALRRFAKESKATQPFVGFGNPLLSGPSGNDRGAWERKTCQDVSGPVRVASRSPEIQLSRFFRNGLANVDVIRSQYPLPETSEELCAVARSTGADDSAVYLADKATETTIKQLSADGTLARARVLHFATHGLLAAESKSLGLDKSEPALILTPPDQATADDDGLLTASEVAQLKLDADWVVLSACNTAAGQRDGAGSEAFSGLARAFFYAGARALLVSHWAVNSEATVSLVTKTFSAVGADGRIGRAEALRRSMLSLIGSGYTHPAYWSPFVVVGEGGR